MIEVMNLHEDLTLEYYGHEKLVLNHCNLSCGSTWYVRCAPICIPGFRLFCLPSTGYVEDQLELLIQHNSSTKLSNKISFQVVS